MYEKITFFSSGGSNGNKSLCMWRWFFHNSNYSSGSKFRFCGIWKCSGG